jgi:hypothetical protein
MMSTSAPYLLRHANFSKNIRSRSQGDFMGVPKVVVRVFGAEIYLGLHFILAGLHVCGKEILG